MQITPPILPPKEKVEDAIVKAYETIKAASDKASTGQTKNIGETLTKYSDDLQKFLDGFLSKRGAITQQQLDELDEKIRETKRKTLEAEAKNTFVRYGIFISVAVVAFGALWLITREKK